MTVSSRSRARAFLWLCYHYHEAPSPNPFSDIDDSHADRVPPFVPLSKEEAAAENVDTAEEHQRGLDMTILRQQFLDTKAKEALAKDSESEFSRPQASGSKGRGRGKGKDLAEIGSVFRLREASPADSHYSTPYSYKEEDVLEGTSAVNGHLRLLSLLTGPGRPPLRRVPSPRAHHFADRRPPSPTYRRHLLQGHPETVAHPRAAADPYPRRPLSPNVELLHHSNGKPLRTQSRKSRHPSQTPVFVHEPFAFPADVPPYPRPVYAGSRYPPPSPETPKRTMLERKWLSPVIRIPFMLKSPPLQKLGMYQ